jgi:uncharacterized protein (AIM24 family)
MIIKNLKDSKNVKITEEGGIFKIAEHQEDLSVHSPHEAMSKYFMSRQGLHKRQLYVELNGKVNCILSAGAMQFTAGNVELATNVKGVGDAIGKFFQGKVTGESAIKPKYSGTGVLVTEPTYKHLHLIDVEQYRSGLVLNDGFFLACEESVNLKTIAAKTLSGAAFVCGS